MNEKRILIVDDDEDIRSNMSDILGDMGYCTSVAADGPEALELLAKSSYDIALLDLRMAGMDGLELYRTIHSLYPETEAFLISAYTGDGVAEEAVRSGILRVFRKPLDVAELIRTIDEALHRLLVLVVDDNKAVACELQEILHQHGYRAGVALTEQDALKHLHSATYEMVLLDIDSEHVNPLRLLAALRQENPNTRVLIVSASSTNQGAIEQLLAGGASGVCYKPIDIDNLLERLRPTT
jgi:CheY-like chemotaxis protein